MFAVDHFRSRNSKIPTDETQFTLTVKENNKKNIEKNNSWRIIKSDNLDNNKDVYIGMPQMILRNIR